MSFESEEKSMIAVIATSEKRGYCIQSPEVIRKSSLTDTLNTSWDPRFNIIHDINEKEYDKTPSFVSIMVTDEPDDPSPTLGNTTTSSTQTEPYLSLPVNCSYVDVSLSFSKDFNIQDSTSNDNSEHSLRSKRFRRDSSDAENKDPVRPWKKTKCTDSCSSSTSDLMESKHQLGPSSSQLSSNSDASFKSINSNHSYKIRKRRLKSDSDLFKDAIQRSRRNTKFAKRNYLDNSTPGNDVFIRIFALSY